MFLFYLFGEKIIGIFLFNLLLIFEFDVINKGVDIFVKFNFWLSFLVNVNLRFWMVCCVFLSVNFDLYINFFIGSISFFFVNFDL